MMSDDDSDQVDSARERTSLSRTATRCKGQFVDPRRTAVLNGRVSDQLER